MIKIYSKTELNQSLKSKVLTSIEKYLGEKIDEAEVEFLIDEKIIGGIKIEIDSEVIDLTLNNRLEKVLEILKDNVG